MFDLNEIDIILQRINSKLQILRNNVYCDKDMQTRELRYSPTVMRLNLVADIMHCIDEQIEKGV
jgi:hypothetical protein